MEKEYFVQQAAFLDDYKNEAKDETINVDQLADQVINQLNETQEDYYLLSGEVAFLVK